MVNRVKAIVEGKPAEDFAHKIAAVVVLGVLVAAVMLQVIDADNAPGSPDVGHKPID